MALNQITTLRQSLDEDVAACVDAGIEGIGLWRPKVAEFGEERATELLRDAGLRVTSLSWAGGFTGQGGYSYADAVDDARDALHSAGRLNAQSLSIVGGPRLMHLKGYARSLVVDGLRELADEADALNVDLALQPMHRTFQESWTFLNSLNAAMDVLQRCRHPRVKLAVDVYQLGWDERFLKRLPECVPHIAVVQLADGRRPPQTRFERRRPGEGRLPLATIVQTLLRHHYVGDFEIAVWSTDLWAFREDSLLEDLRREFERLAGS
ncbi:MAG: sugar phosphate isomerase/epimerase family protein [Planctomycetaceae bacterium]